MNVSLLSILLRPPLSVDEGEVFGAGELEVRIDGGVFKARHASKRLVEVGGSISKLEAMTEELAHIENPDHPIASLLHFTCAPLMMLSAMPQDRDCNEQERLHLVRTSAILCSTRAAEASVW